MGRTVVKIFFNAIIVFLLMAAISLADSTQQYNTIYLKPYSVNSISNGVFSNYTVDVNPPDNIASVISAIVRFKALTAVSINISAWVNNQKCSTPWVYLSTTFGGAGQYDISFDCSNIITKSGSYNVSIRPSGANMGSTNGWLELTYMNNPLGELSIFGTEYFQGDVKGSICAQVVDTSNQPVTDAICSATLAHSSTYNISMPAYFTDQAMLAIAADKAMYCYSFNLPNETGVMPASVSCVYAVDPVWRFPAVELGGGCSDRTIYMTVESGTLESGSATFLNSYEDAQYNQILSSTGTPKIISIIFKWNETDECKIDRNASQSLVILWSSQTSTVNVNNFYMMNWTSGSYVSIGSMTSLGSGSPTSIGAGDDFYSYDFSDKKNDLVADNGTVIMKYNSSAPATWRLFHNWLSIRLIQNISQIVGTIRGGGEVHINPLINATVSGNVTIGGNITADSSWYELKYSGATEYKSDEPAEIAYQFLRIAAGNPVPVNDGVCNVSIWYPNKTLWVNKTAMTYLSGSDGIYYYDFTAPSTEGGYTTGSYCIKGGTTVYSSSTFHVAPWANAVIGIGTNLTSVNSTLSGQLTQNYNAILSVNSTLNFWGGSLNSTLFSMNGTLTFWGSLLNSSMVNMNETLYNLGLQDIALKNQILGNISSLSLDMFNNFTSLNSTIDYWGNLIYGKPACNVTNYTINVTNAIVYNQTVNLTNYTINVTDYLLNLTNYTIEVVNQTLNLTVLNQTVNVTDYLLNLTNYTINITNQIVEVVNQTLNLTVLNQTVNVTDYILNLTNYTINVTQPVIEITNYTLNITEVNLTILNQTVNVTNQTVNVTVINQTVDLSEIENKLDIMNNTLNSIAENITSVNSTMNFWFNLVISSLNDNFTMINNTINSWGSYLNQTIYNLNMTCPAPIVNLTTEVVNVTNYTLNISQPIIEITNYTLNLTNYTVNVYNVTPIFNITNYTINVTQPIIEITNYTINLTNETHIINLTNYSIELTNYTLNLTEYLLNLTNYTIDVTTYTLNITNVTPVLVNYTLNITNATYNYTQQVNLTCPALNLTNVTVNATVDTHAVAVDTLREFCYYGAIDIYDPGVCQGPLYRGQHT